MFSNDEVNGLARKSWPDGSVYEGEFRNGFEEGYGVRTYSNGDVYDGEWKDGKRNGQGMMCEGGVCT